MDLRLEYFSKYPCVPLHPIQPSWSKTYDAILTNKKKKEKAGTIGGIASGQVPLSVEAFLTRVITGSLGQSIGRMSTV